MINCGNKPKKPLIGKINLKNLHINYGVVSGIKDDRSIRRKDDKFVLEEVTNLSS